jgi:hypothetical protein
MTDDKDLKISELEAKCADLVAKLAASEATAKLLADQLQSANDLIRQGYDHVSLPDNEEY